MIERPVKTNFQSWNFSRAVDLVLTLPHQTVKLIISADFIFLNILCELLWVMYKNVKDFPTVDQNYFATVSLHCEIEIWTDKRSPGLCLFTNSPFPQVRRIYPHPEYNASSIDNDVALLYLPPPPPFLSTTTGLVSPGVTDRACLPSGGWGGDFVVVFLPLTQSIVCPCRRGLGSGEVFYLFIFIYLLFFFIYFLCF